MNNNDLQLSNILSLQEELSEAIENIDYYYSVGDIRLANMWEKILDNICVEIRRL